MPIGKQLKKQTFLTLLVFFILFGSWIWLNHSKILNTSNKTLPRQSESKASWINNRPLDLCKLNGYLTIHSKANHQNNY